MLEKIIKITIFLHNEKFKILELFSLNHPEHFDTSFEKFELLI